MNKGFWENLKRPIFALAPMANVTDAAFRRIIAKYGKPDVMWTEFVSADGLALAPEEGRQKLLLDLKYSESERPIVAQFFTSSPENMKKAAELAVELGFDGIDINMGCPDKTIEKQGAGAALMKNPALAREVLRAAKEGARSTSSGQAALPVSVKTRVGFNKPELESWLPEILKEEPAVVTIHARTRKEMSKVPARWEFVKRAVEIRDETGSKTLIFGNGDVPNLEVARQKVEETGCDGVMLGRAIFGNPWLFTEREPSTEEKLKVLIEHTKLFEKLLGHIKSFAIMKKHFKAYINGFEGAGELRARLMETENALEVEEIINQFLE
ncbi:MAG: tRNA-dihydrouridine synthase [bacterium]|nr:tRNA-dihydrouridine synthase [bacterium]